MTNVNKWSLTAANNSSADGDLWQEGQSAASVNNSARDNMAAVAAYRDDIAGALTSSGSGSAYTVTTNSSNADAQALRKGFKLAIRVHTTNTSTAPTLAVDGGTAKVIKKNGGAIASSDLKANGIYDFYGSSATYEVGAAITAAAGATPLFDGTEASTPIASGDFIYFTDVSDSSGSKKATLGSAITNSSAAKLDVENQILTGGVQVTSKSLGKSSGGTLTLDLGDRPLQHYTNGGAHTLAPSSKKGSALIEITNDSSAGAITTTGWNTVDGTAFSTTSGDIFLCHASVNQTKSYLNVAKVSS